MANPQPSHRHHYVPQFYLRHWTEDGKLHRYKREPSGKLSEKPEPTKSTGFRDDLYTVEDVAWYMTQPVPDVIERDFFKPLDDAAAKVLTKLVSDAEPTLSDEERASWALFLNSLLERNPRTLQAYDEIAPQLVEKVKNDLLARNPDAESNARLLDVLRRFDQAAMARNSVRERMVKDIRHPQTIAYFKGLQWMLLPKPLDVDFITTDSPLLVNMGQEQRPIQFMSIALSPDKMLMMFPEAWQNEFNTRFLMNYALLHNFLLIEAGAEFLYSRGPLKDGQFARPRLAAESAFGRPGIQERRMRRLRAAGSPTR